MTFNWIEVEKRNLGNIIELPNLRQVEIKNNPAHNSKYVNIPLKGKWNIYKDSEHGIIKLERNKDKNIIVQKSSKIWSLNSVFYLNAGILNEMNWRQNPEKSMARSFISVWRYIPNIDTIYYFQNKNLIEKLRNIHEKENSLHSAGKRDRLY